MSRCPLCSDNTRLLSRGERCVRSYAGHSNPCPAHHITRKERGEAWAWNERGQIVHQPYPNSVAPTRQGPRRAEIRAATPDRFATHDPTDKPADPGSHLSLVVPFGRGTKEHDAA